MVTLKSALEEKTKEVASLQRVLNRLLSTMTKAKSSGPIHLNGIDLSGTEHGTSLEGLVVQSQTQVCRFLSVCLCVRVFVRP